ncbi:polymorphic toxin type 50 domain-containing protein [Paraburkholderia silvatlantica]|uniref:polymorphic toxin type 50 domain-containing protein n=1 Tax=Paraburkholderia silvatlantica TaxID=321895 RepID=UPI0037521C31
MHVAGGALIGGLGGGALGAVGGGFGAGLSSKLADRTKAIRDAVSDATDSTLLGNITANIVSGLGGALVGGSAGAAGAANVNLYNQGHDTGEAAAEKKAVSLTQQVADAYNYLQQLRQSVGDAVSSAAGQFVGKMDADARAKASEPATDLMAQGAANGLNTIIGAGAGTPPTASAGGVLVDAAAGQAMAGAANSVPSNAIFNSDENGPAIEEGKQGKHQPGHNNFTPGKSEFTYPDPQQLANDHAGTGQPANSVTPGAAGYRERVDFGTIIGNWVDPSTGQKTPTTNGIIHYSKDGVHIVPSRP